MDKDFLIDMDWAFNHLHWMGMDASVYFHWKKANMDDWQESASADEKTEPQEPKSAKEKLEQAEVAEYEVVDDTSMVLGYAH